MSEQNKSFIGPVFGTVLALIIIAGAAFGLHSAGIIDLSPLINRFTGVVPENMEEGSAIDTGFTASSLPADTEQSTVGQSGLADAVTSSGESRQEKSDSRISSGGTDVAAGDFTPTAIGSKVTVQMKAGNFIAGELKQIKANSIVVTSGKADITLLKDLLTDESLALFYSDSHAALRAKIETQRLLSEAQRLSANTAAQPAPVVPAPVLKTTAEKTKPAKFTPHLSKPVPVRKTSSESWTEQGQETDLLKARRERVRRHEEEAAKAGEPF